MLNLFRGGPYVWLSEEEAATIGIRDNDWVEAINANGATVARAVVSQRIPRGMAIMRITPRKRTERARLEHHRQAWRHP